MIDPGLCGACVHARIVESRRSRFWLCGLSRVDPTFPRYPALPVIRCAGFETGRSKAGDAGEMNHGEERDT